MGDAFKLIIEDDEGKRNVVPVDLGEVTVGRLDGNAIRLNERNISRSHMRLVKENSHVFAEDLDSYNGVFINGGRITARQAIHEGDLIRVGDFHLELRGEGLARRAEETTQKTIVPDLDSTQPEIRVDEKTEIRAPPTAPGMSMGEPMPPQMQAAPTPIAQPQPAEPRAEPTAIIRMDHLQSLADNQRRDTGVITGAKPKLICVATQFAGQQFEISTAEAVIGRTDDNEIAVDHRSVSRHHAKIVSTGNSYRIVDLGSANGTLVNGEQYAQLALKAGDLIELGHVKFRFVPPEATYNLTEEERAIVSGKGTASLPPTFQDGIPTQVQTTLIDHVRANPFGAIGAGAVVLGVLIFVAWLLFSGEKDLAVEVAPEASAGHLGHGTASPGAVDKIIAKAREFMARREWKKAVRLLELAIEKDPTADTAMDLLDKAQAELDAQKNLEAANRAIKANDWNGAWNALNDIPEASLYFREADSLRTQVRRAMITERLNAARAAGDAGQRTRAAEIVQEIETLDPGNVQARDLRAALDANAAAPSPRAAPHKSRSERDVNPPPRPEPAKTKPAKKPKPKPEPAPASGGDAKSYYKKGIAALQGGQTRKAIDSFNKCVQTDRSFCLCYRALGISHARDGNGPKAARYYKLYLKYCPTAKDAAQVRKLLDAYGQ